MYSTYTATECEEFKNYPFVPLGIDKKADILVFDFLEFYILRLSESTKFIKDYYERMTNKIIEIYNEIGYPVEVINTCIKSNVKQLKSVQNILGEIIFDKDILVSESSSSYSKQAKIDIINKKINIILDYEKLLLEHNINTEFKDSTIPPDNVKITGNIIYNSISSRLIEKPNHFSKHSELPPTNIQGNSSDLQTFNSKNTVGFTYINDVVNENDKQIIVLYNKIINNFYVTMSELNFMKDICSEFSQFELMGAFMNEPKLHNELTMFFHKKYYTTEDAYSKFNSYISLFNLKNLVLQEKKKDDMTGEEYDLKRDFKNVLSTHFEISNDPKNKMKANDLYQLLIKLIKENYLHSNSSFRRRNLDFDLKSDVYNLKGSDVNRRLSCLLIEEGLIKKRYSDGFYYYGIKQLESSVSFSASTEDVLKHKNNSSNARRDFKYFNLSEINVSNNVTSENKVRNETGLVGLNSDSNHSSHYTNMCEGYENIKDINATGFVGLNSDSSHSSNWCEAYEKIKETDPFSWDPRKFKIPKELPPMINDNTKDI